MLIIRVSDNAAHVESGLPIPSGSVSNPKIKFILDDFWKDYAVTARYLGSGKTVDQPNIRSGKEYKVPWECITESGVLTLKVYGVNGNSVATTEQTTVQIVDSGINTANFPQEPTPSAYQQYVAQVHTDAQNAHTDAETAQECAAISRQCIESIGSLPDLLNEANGLIKYAQNAANETDATLAAANEACEIATEAAKRKPEALVEANHGREVRFWFGTKAEYAEQLAAGSISDTTYCILTDDTSVQEVVAALATVQGIFAGQYGEPEVISDALLISIDDPLSSLNTHRWKITPESANHPAIDEETANNFIGIREPVIRLDNDIVAVVRMTEIAPVFGRQWITRFSVAEDNWYNNGWAVLATPQI